MHLDEGLIIGLRRLGRGSMVLFAVALPFELVDPIARVGPLQLSSVEVFLYATVGLWGLARIAMAATMTTTMTTATSGIAAPWWRRVPETHLAVAAWSLVLILSAVLAPVARAAAIKFALRSLGGVALYLAAADLLRAPRAVERNMIALGAGGAAAALLMALESIAPDAAKALRPFHGQGFGVLGLLRASGPFQYPNIAAMYLEGVLPLLLAASVVAATAATRDQSRRAITVSTAAIALAVLYAMVLAASRAGLIASLVVLSGIVVAAQRDPGLRRLAMLSIGGLVVLTVLIQAASPMLALRLRFWNERAWHRSTIEPAADPALALPSRLDPGASATVGLVIRNDGAITWTHEGKGAVFVSYHWHDEATGAVRVREGVRTALPRDLPPGASTTLSATVHAPTQPGRYILRWDPVQEGVTWFGDRGDQGRVEKVTVALVGSSLSALPRSRLPARSTGTVAPRAQKPAPPTLDPFDGVSRRELWRAGLAAWRTRPVLGIGPDNFRRVYGTYLGRPNADDRLHANNLYVETLTNLGAAGLLALAALMLTLGRAVRRAVRVPETRVLALGAGGALAAYAVHGTLDYFLEFTPTYGLMWLVAGMTVALDRAGNRLAHDA